jgi:hypothetical protein
MTIFATLTRNQDNSPHFLRIEVTEESIKIFQALVQRALNCWDSAPKELKDLGDMLTHGYITQDHTYTPINTKQNTDYYTREESDIIETFIQLNGVAAWQEHLRDGTTNKVLNRTV